jgi:hypothetical protein
MKRPTTLRAIAIALLLGILALAPIPAANAQFAIAYEEPIALSPQELAGFNRIFHSTPAQETSAKTLTDAANAELKEQENKAAKIGDAWRALPKDKRTPEGREKLLKDLDAAAPDVAGLRRKLLLDLRALLADKQDADWPRFERFLRRFGWQTKGWGAEKTNILGLVEKLDLEPPARVALDDLLDHYERELDALLLKLEPQYEAMNKENLAIWSRRQQAGIHDESAPHPAGAEHTATCHRLVQLNDSFSARLRALLPDDKKTAWDQLYQQATLTEAYGLLWRWVDLAIRDSVNLPALSDDRRDKIRAFLPAYTAGYDELTAKIAKMEKLFRAAAPDEHIDTTDWDPSRIRRGNLLSEAQQKLKEILTDAQFDRLIHQWSDQDRAWNDAMIR